MIFSGEQEAVLIHENEGVLLTTPQYNIPYLDKLFSDIQEISISRLMAWWSGKLDFLQTWE